MGVPTYREGGQAGWDKIPSLSKEIKLLAPLKPLEKNAQKSIRRCPSITCKTCKILETDETAETVLTEDLEKKQ